MRSSLVLACALVAVTHAVEFTGVFFSRLHEPNTNDSSVSAGTGYRCWASGGPVEMKLDLLLDTSSGVLAVSGEDGTPLLPPLQDFKVRGWRGLYSTANKPFNFYEWNLTSDMPFGKSPSKLAAFDAAQPTALLRDAMRAAQDSETVGESDGITRTGAGCFQIMFPIDSYGHKIYRLREFAAAGPGALKASPAGEGLVEASYQCDDSEIINRGEQHSPDCDSSFASQRPSQVQSMGTLVEQRLGWQPDPWPVCSLPSPGADLAAAVAMAAGQLGVNETLAQALADEGCLSTRTRTVRCADSIGRDVGNLTACSLENSEAVLAMDALRGTGPMPLHEQACVPPAESCVRRWRELAGASAGASGEQLAEGADATALLSQSTAGAAYSQKHEAVPAPVRTLRNDPLASGVVLPWEVLPGGSPAIAATNTSDSMSIPAAHHEWKVLLGTRKYMLSSSTSACLNDEFLLAPARVRFEEPAVGLEAAPNGTSAGGGAAAYQEQPGHNASMPLAPLMDLEVLNKGATYRLTGLELTAADPPTHGFRRAITGFQMGAGEQAASGANATGRGPAQPVTVISLATTTHSGRTHAGNPEEGPSAFGVRWVRRSQPLPGSPVASSDALNPSDEGVAAAGAESPLDALDGGHHSAWLSFSVEADGAKVALQNRGDEEPVCDPYNLPGAEYSTIVGVATAGPTRLLSQSQRQCAFVTTNEGVLRNRCLMVTPPERCVNAVNEDVAELFCLPEKPTGGSELECGNCTEWEVLDWSQCSLDCGGGSQSRSVRCRDPRSNETLSDDACLLTGQGPRPASTRSCNYIPCMPDGSNAYPAPSALEFFLNGTWSACSAPCNGVGQRTRSVYCRERTGARRGPLHDGICEMVANLTKPATLEACVGPECGTFVAEAWGECSVNCGPGAQTRSVLCRGTTTNTALNPTVSCAGQTMPQTSRPCQRCDCIPDTPNGFHLERWLPPTQQYLHGVSATAHAAAMLGTGTDEQLDAMHLDQLRLGDGVPEALVTLAMADAVCPATGGGSSGWQLLTVGEWSCLERSAQLRLCDELHQLAGGKRLPVAFRAQGVELDRLTAPAWLPQSFNESEAVGDAAARELQRPDAFRRKLLGGCPFTEAGVSGLEAGPYDAFVNPARQAALAVCRAV